MSDNDKSMGVMLWGETRMGLIKAFDLYLAQLGPNKTSEYLKVLAAQIPGWLNRFHPYTGCEPFCVLREGEVVVRKDHKCNWCGENTIKKGNRCYHATLHTDEGLFSDYICFGCLMDCCGDTYR